MAALDRLEADDALDADDADVLREAYRFCERTRNRWFLVNSAPGDALPQQPEKLARLGRVHLGRGRDFWPAGGGRSGTARS